MKNFSRFITAGILCLTFSTTSAVAQDSTVMSAVKTTIDKKYAKKYDDFSSLSDDEGTVTGIYKKNCQSLNATHCHYLKTSYMNVVPPYSRAEKIIDKAVGACKSVGGNVKIFSSLHGMRSISSIAKENPNASPEEIEKTKVRNWLVENLKVPSRGDYIKPTFYSVCAKEGESDVITVTASSSVNLENDESGAALYSKGKLFIYIAEMDASKSQIQGAASDYQTCMSRPVEAGDMVHNKKRGFTQSGELVIEVKGPVAQIQGSKDARWVKMADLEIHPENCRS